MSATGQLPKEPMTNNATENDTTVPKPPQRKGYFVAAFEQEWAAANPLADDMYNNPEKYKEE